ncbi:PQQ-binding-like beta-propeller repeat protein [Haloparvum sp. PAK95]|uniref:outer membrane protein assembly factor BamB family protein n=1 Tax=Haloparvum sp. PAK95 TaxID=3418962 RepID=UPI003D2F3BC6
MDRRSFIRLAAVPTSVAVAGCSGGSSSDGQQSPTPPEEVQEAKEEYSETPEDSETPSSQVKPVDWISRAKDGTNSRFVPTQTFTDSDYSTNWEARVGEPRYTAMDVIAGDGQLFVLKSNEFVAYSGAGERVWQIRDHDLRSIVYADGFLGALNQFGDLLILDAKTGKRTGLLKEGWTEPYMREAQATDSGHIAYLFESSNVHLRIVNPNDGELVFDSELDGFDGNGTTAPKRLLTEGDRLYLIGHEPENYSMKVQVRNAQSGAVESEFTKTWVDDNDMDNLADSTIASGQLISAMTADEDLSGDGKIASGLISYTADGSQNWVANDLLGTETVLGVCSDGDRAYLISPETIVAVSASDGSKQWEYSNRNRFAEDAGILTEGKLLIPDDDASSGIRVHAIDTQSGEATRTQLVTEDDQPTSYSDAVAHLRPASEGIYTMGQTLRHITPNNTN